MTRAGWRARCVFFFSPRFPLVMGLLAPQEAMSTLSESHFGLSVTLNAVRVWVAAETKPSFPFLVLQRSLHLHCAGEAARATHHREVPRFTSLVLGPCVAQHPFLPLQSPSSQAWLSAAAFFTVVSLYFIFLYIPNWELW